MDFLAIKRWFYRVQFFGRKDRIEFYELLLSYADAGKNLTDFLIKMDKRYKIRKDERNVMSKEWVKSINEGYSLADSLRRWIPSTEYMILQAVSTTKHGQTVALAKCIYLLRAEQEMSDNLTPIFRTIGLYLLVLIALVVGFIFYMFPQLVESIDPEVIANNVFVGQIAFIKDNFFLIFMAIGALVFVVIKSLKWRPGRFRKVVLDKIPPYSIIKLYRSSMLLVVVSTMLASGMTLTNVLTFLRSNSDPWLRYYLVRMIERHNSGNYNTGLVFDIDGLFSQQTMDRISDYSEIGGFEKQVDKIGEAALKDTVRKIERLKPKLNLFFQILFALCLIWLISGVAIVVMDGVKTST